MKVYRWVWSVFWLVVGALPVAIGLVVAPVAAFCIGVLTATASATVAAADDRWTTDMWLRAGLLGAGAAAVLSSSGSAGFWLLALAVATSPPVLSRATNLRRGATGRRARTSAEVTSVPSPVPHASCPAPVAPGPLQDQQTERIDVMCSWQRGTASGMGLHNPTWTARARGDGRQETA